MLSVYCFLKPHFTIMRAKYLRNMINYYTGLRTLLDGVKDLNLTHVSEGPTPHP